jgi:hypothetical protein
VTVEAVLTAIGALQVLQLVNQLVLIRGLRSVRKTMPPGPLIDPDLVADLRQLGQLAGAIVRRQADDAEVQKRG